MESLQLSPHPHLFSLRSQNYDRGRAEYGFFCGVTHRSRVKNAAKDEEDVADLLSRCLFEFLILVSMISEKHAVGLKAGERVAAAPGPYLNHLSAISSSQELPEGSKSATAHSPRCNVFCCLQTGSVIELFSPGINLLFLSSRRQTLKYKRKKIMDHERQWFLFFFYFAARRHKTF